MHRVISVSYTHLDVYKRQELNHVCSFMMSFLCVFVCLQVCILNIWAKCRSLQQRNICFLMKTKLSCLEREHVLFSTQWYFAWLQREAIEMYKHGGHNINKKEKSLALNKYLELKHGKTAKPIKKGKGCDWPVWLTSTLKNCMNRSASI